MESIILKYHNGTAFTSFTFYCTNAIQAIAINKITGEAFGELYQHNISKRYSYNVNLFLSEVSPYATTLAAQKAFLYNFFTANKQRISGTIDGTTFADVDVICETNGVAQLDLVENSKYIRTINLILNEKQNKTGAF